MATFLGAEENPGPPQANLAGQINQGTANTLQEMNLASEENAANIRHGGDQLAKYFTPVTSYQQGQTHAMQMAQGQQQLDRGELARQGQQLGLEQTQQEMGDTARKRAMLTHVEGNGQTAEQNMFGAEEQHAMGQGARDTADLAASQQSTAASKAQVNLAQQTGQEQSERFAYEQHLNKIQAAGAEYAAAYGNNDTGMVNSINAKYASVGLSPAEISLAQRNGYGSLSSGISAKDMVADSTQQGVQANDRVNDLDAHVTAATKIADSVKAYHAAGWRSPQREAAKAEIVKGLEHMGAGEQADYIVNGPTLSTDGFTNESDRIDAATQKAFGGLNNQMQEIQAEHGARAPGTNGPQDPGQQGLPSSRFQARLKGIGQGLGYVKQTAGDLGGQINVVGAGQGHGSPTDLSQQNSSFVSGKKPPPANVAGPGSVQAPPGGTASPSQIFQKASFVKPQPPTAPISRANSANANPNSLPSAQQGFPGQNGPPPSPATFNPQTQQQQAGAAQQQQQQQAPQYNSLKNIGSEE